MFFFFGRGRVADVGDVGAGRALELAAFLFDRQLAQRFWRQGNTTAAGGYAQIKECVSGRKQEQTTREIATAKRKCCSRRDREARRWEFCDVMFQGAGIPWFAGVERGRTVSDSAKAPAMELIRPQRRSPATSEKKRI